VTNLWRGIVIHQNLEYIHCTVGENFIYLFHNLMWWPK